MVGIPREASVPGMSALHPNRTLDRGTLVGYKAQRATGWHPQVKCCQPTYN